MNNKTLRQQIDSYYQELLILQFKASNGISHNPTKGSMREEFIKGLIEGIFPNVKLGKGILTKGKWESSQIDLFKIKPNAKVYTIGGQNITELDDCLLMMEIKSDAVTKHLDELQKLSSTIKEMNENVKCGIFCYNINLTQKTVLDKFGFTYQGRELDFYRNNGDVIYPDIDFIISLEAKKDNECPYLIVKNITGEYVIIKNNPIINDFLGLFKDI